jgi:hypothetical protein
MPPLAGLVFGDFTPFGFSGKMQNVAFTSTCPSNNFSRNTMLRNYFFGISGVFSCLILSFSSSLALAYDNGRVPVNTPESAQRMVENLIATFGEKYPKGAEYLKRLQETAEKKTGSEKKS